MILEGEILAVFVARVILGVLFFAQGYDKVFNVKLAGVISTFEKPVYKKRIPRFLLVLATYYTSYIELIGGLLLISGFMIHFALAFLAFDLIMAAVAFSVIKPMWDMQYFFPRLVLLIFLLLVPAGWDIISVDYLLARY